MRINTDGPEVGYDDSRRLLYRGELFTGEAVEYHPSGSVIALTTYADGQEDGPSREWFPDGTPESEGTTSKGYPVGTWRTWNQQGVLVEERTFDEKGNELRLRKWSDGGEPVSDEEYAPHW